MGFFVSFSIRIEKIIHHKRRARKSRGVLRPHSFVRLREKSLVKKPLAFPDKRYFGLCLDFLIYGVVRVVVAIYFKVLMMPGKTAGNEVLCALFGNKKSPSSVL
jgi:hypothetical protein